ncbi:MAG TPA: hypothetical protein DDX19_15600 [Rhodopirellula baltica]|uniref:Uncharacterized protein n=1 Tax=Rhodopirellula baltica (strain DSM 10527 / NCIMB 13988 / SH1) TaxID=243090 RepID=Q7UVI5_RHOBA|nr:hypothetical protein RB2618 [Rhodopirellula baltica SH 1]HBE64131.1 hypothetical protein [Rhodopirellula baltica]
MDRKRKQMCRSLRRSFCFISRNWVAPATTNIFRRLASASEKLHQLHRFSSYARSFRCDELFIARQIISVLNGPDSADW